MLRETMLRNTKKAILDRVERHLMCAPRIQDVRKYVETRKYFEPLHDLMLDEGVNVPFLTVVNRLVKDGFIEINGERIKSKTF